MVSIFQADAIYEESGDRKSIWTLNIDRFEEPVIAIDSSSTVEVNEAVSRQLSLDL